MIHSFFITPDGQSRSVYSDSLVDIYDQIEHEKQRASNIEFDNVIKKWVAIDEETGHIITAQKLRADAVTIEIEYLKNKFRNSQRYTLEKV